MIKNAYQAGGANNYNDNDFTQFIKKEKAPDRGWLSCTKDAAKRIEGEGFLAFKWPMNEDLVIPTGSYTDFGHFIEKASDREIHQYFKGICQVLSDRNSSHTRVIMNNGQDSGQEVFHLHAHFKEKISTLEDKDPNPPELKKKDNFFSALLIETILIKLYLLPLIENTLLLLNLLKMQQKKKLLIFLKA